jgi:hypothetical protein
MQARFDPLKPEGLAANAKQLGGSWKTQPFETHVLRFHVEKNHWL